jgi:hypothetical protein
MLVALGTIAPQQANEKKPWMKLSIIKLMCNTSGLHHLLLWMERNLGPVDGPLEFI